MSLGHRIELLRKKLIVLKIDAIVVTHPVDLYYLTGLVFSAGTLLITAYDGHLLVDGRYFDSAKAACTFPVLLSKEGTFKELLASLGRGKTLAFDGSVTTYHSYQMFKKVTDELGLELTSQENLLKELRSIKDEGEIACLKAAAHLASRGSEHVRSLLREGITEKEVAQQLEIFWLNEGGDGPSFSPIIAFGAHSASPHHGSCDTPLKRGDHVLVDIGVCVNRYQSDMTRIFFWGPGSSQLREIAQIVQRAKEAATALCQPGRAVGELDAQARKVITDAGYGDYFSHSLGHGVGLEIHEAPLLRDKDPYRSTLLEPNMVITIEPGIYLPGVGGVRLEDTLRITSQGYEPLTFGSLVEELK